MEENGQRLQHTYQAARGSNVGKDLLTIWTLNSKRENGLMTKKQY
jgi:hypothetical protein